MKARTWATSYRVPIAAGRAYFKACAPVQAFEPRMSRALFDRWPDRVGVVLAHDVERAWLLTADAGTAIGELGNDPAIWERILPRYAEIQRAEAAFAADHLAHGVPDQRLVSLAGLYGELLGRDLPLGPGELAALRAGLPAFVGLCRRLEETLPIESVQHDDLHVNAVFVRGDELRVLDWGDASIGHPFFSLVVTFQFLREVNGLAAADPWFDRLRDAYLEPWGPTLRPAFDLAQRVGTVAHAFTWMRVRDTMTLRQRVEFDEEFPAVLRRAIDALQES